MFFARVTARGASTPKSELQGSGIKPKTKNENWLGRRLYATSSNGRQKAHGPGDPDRNRGSVLGRCGERAVLIRLTLPSFAALVARIAGNVFRTGS
jgi:hypothetical protein